MRLHACIGFEHGMPSIGAAAYAASVDQIVNISDIL
jgi:hypothetical protein